MTEWGQRLLWIILMLGVAHLLLAAGITGLVAPDLLPRFSRPNVAWSSIAVGVGLDIAAIMQLLAAYRQRSREI